MDRRLADPSTKTSSSDAGFKGEGGSDGLVAWRPLGCEIPQTIVQQDMRKPFSGRSPGASGKNGNAFFSVKLAWESGSIMPFCGCGLFLPPSFPVNDPSVLEQAGVSKGQKVEMDGKHWWMEIGWRAGAPPRPQPKPNHAPGHTVVVANTMCVTHPHSQVVGAC